MRINKIPVLIFCLMGVLFLITGKAYADASWQWFTQTRRYDVLSYDAAGAILIEALSINFIPRINRPVKVFGVVTAGNLISFLAPYALKALDSPNGLLQTYSQQLEENYYFIICAVYLFITLLVELLFVYGFLDKGRLRGLNCSPSSGQ